MEIARDVKLALGSLDQEKEAIFDACWAKPIEKESPEVLSHMEAKKTMGKMIKAKCRTHAPKPMVFGKGALGR